jgi:hypothetical protein
MRNLDIRGYETCEDPSVPIGEVVFRCANNRSVSSSNSIDSVAHLQAYGVR